MKNLFKAPGENRTSMTKVVATAIMGLPVVQEALQPGGFLANLELTEDRVFQVAMVLVGAAIIYLRRAVPNLDKLLEGYQQSFRDRQELQETRDTLAKARDHLLRENRRLREQLGEPTPTVLASED